MKTHQNDAALPVGDAVAVVWDAQVRLLARVVGHFSLLHTKLSDKWSRSVIAHIGGVVCALFACVWMRYND